MDQPLVSYVICAYNGAEFLEESIASVLGQTYPHIELVVVDDGSTDGTPQILEGIKDPRVRVVRQPNMGVEFAASRGISLARGRYIGHVGQDDLLLPDKTEVQLRAMAERGWDFCATWVEMIDARGQPLDHFFGPLYNQPSVGRAEALSRLAVGNYLAESSALCHRRCFGSIVFSVGMSCVGDYFRWLQLFQRFAGGVLERPLARIRIHDRNTNFEPRFSREYRQLEERAARVLTLLDGDPIRPAAFLWSEGKLRALLAEVEWLVSSGDPALGLLAYLTASRALNRSPFDPRCYRALSGVLSWLGHEYPAQLLFRRADHVGGVFPFSVPLVPSAPRGLYRRARPLLDAASGGGWHRFEARLLNALGRPRASL